MKKRISGHVVEICFDQLPALITRTPESPTCQVKLIDKDLSALWTPFHRRQLDGGLMIRVYEAQNWILWFGCPWTLGCRAALSGTVTTELWLRANRKVEARTMAWRVKLRCQTQLPVVIELRLLHWMGQNVGWMTSTLVLVYTRSPMSTGLGTRLLHGQGVIATPGGLATVATRREYPITFDLLTATMCAGKRGLTRLVRQDIVDYIVGGRGGRGHGAQQAVTSRDTSTIKCRPYRRNSMLENGRRTLPWNK